jgi:purine nucleosidase
MQELNVILDTDIGTNPDDLFGLLLLLHIPTINLRLIVTGNNHPVERARMTKKVLENEGRSDIPVYAGEPTGHIDFNGGPFIEGYTPDISTNYLPAIKKVLDTHQNVVYMNIQGCSNLSRVITEYPEYKSKLNVYHMGMTTKSFDDFISGGTNMEADPRAARHVYESEINLKVVGSHTTINDALRINPETSLYQKIDASTHPNHKLFIKHLKEYHARRTIWPALHDPLTIAAAIDPSFVEYEEVQIEFNDEGKYKKGTGSKIVLSKNESKAAEFMAFCEKWI